MQYTFPLSAALSKLHSNMLFWIVYLNVIVHIVTVNNIIHAITINSGSFMLLTFEKMSQVKDISFCREMRKFEGSHLCIYQLQWQIQGRAGVGQPPPPPLIFTPNWGQKGRKKLFLRLPKLTHLQGRSQQFGIQGFLRWYYCCERHWVRVHVLR